jgi:hypothetical protein
VKLPFWVHQLMEYALGLALLLQAPHADLPVVLLAAGAGVIILGATARGPLAAWRGVDRRMHRRLDLAVAAVAIVVAVVFWSRLGLTSGGTLIVVALFLLLLASSVDVRERPPRTWPGRGSMPSLPKDSEQVGRAAGRVVVKGVQAYRNRKRGGG